MSLLLCAVGLAAARAVLITEYTWTDGATPSTNHDWNDADNWTGAAGYPDGTDDDAVFPTHNTPWTVEQKAHHINELTIERDVSFTGEATLTTDLLTVDADGGEITIEIAASSSSGKLIANP